MPSSSLSTCQKVGHAAEKIPSHPECAICWKASMISSRLDLVWWLWFLFLTWKKTNFIILSLPFRKLLLEPVSVPCGHTFCGALRKRGRSARLAAHVYSPASRCQPLLRSGLLESGLGLQELITKFVTRMEVKGTPPQLPCSALQECLFGMPSTSASRASRQYTNPPAS